MNIHQIYTRLSLVKEEQTPSGSPQSELNHYTEVFIDGEGNTQKRILVQGQTGIGKTTFVKKVAVDWAELNDEKTVDDVKRAKRENCEVESNDGPGKGLGLNEIRKQALKKFELVLVVNLKEASKCRTLREVICHCNIFPEEDSDLVDQMLSYISKNQEKVLLLFDGYDEYGCGRDSEIYNVFRGKKLRNCSVLITTRISKADELREFKDFYAEITGFSEQDRLSFMCRFFGSETEAEELVSHLNGENLMDLAKIPLLLLFFCTLWKKGKLKTFPATKTSLYLGIVQYVLDYNQGKTSPAQFSKVDDFKDILADIGKVALECLLKDDHVFEYDQLSNAILCEESRIIGLLQVTEYAENLRPAGMVSFIHKSIQEFLAAWYVTYRCVSEKCLGGMEEHARAVESCAALKNVFQFICGLSNDGAVVVLDHFRSVRIALPDLDLSNILPDLKGGGVVPLFDLSYRQVKFHDFVYHTFQEVQSKDKLIQSCFDCVGGVVLITSSLAQLLQQVKIETLNRAVRSTAFVYDSSFVDIDSLYDCVTVESLRRVLKTLRCVDVPFREKESSDLLLVEKFMQHIESCVRTRSGDNGSFGVVLSFVDDQLLTYITCLDLCCKEFAGLLEDISTSCGSANLSCLKFLTYLRCNCSLEDKHSENLGAIVKTCEYLKWIAFVNAWDNVCDILEQVPSPSSCSTLIDFNCNSWSSKHYLTSAGAVKLGKLLLGFKSILTLFANLSECRVAAVETLVSSITHHHTFVAVKLKEIKLTPAVVRALGRALPEMLALEELVLTGPYARILDQDDMEKLLVGTINTLPSSTRLPVTEPVGGILEAGDIETLFGGFNKTLPLKALTFSDFYVRDCINSLAKSLSYFPHLRELDLGRFDLGQHDLSILLCSLGCIPNLRELRVSGKLHYDAHHCKLVRNTPGSWFAHKNLQRLELERVNLTRAAALFLGTALAEMSSLKVLVLNKVGGKFLEKEGMEMLFGGFKKPLPLRQLIFSYADKWNTFPYLPLTKCLQFFPNLEALTLKNGDMDADGLRYLLESLKPRIEVLCVSMGFREHYTAEFKVEEWRRDKLNELHLTGLSMTEATASVLGGVLPEMASLKSLTYRGTGWHLVSQPVMGLLFGGFNKTLHSLTLKDVFLGNGLAALTKNLHFFPNLRRLWFIGLNIEEYDFCSLLESCRSVPFLESLSILKNLVDFNDSFILAKMKKPINSFAHSSLKEISLDGVCISSAVALVLGQLLPNISSLETLKVTRVDGNILPQWSLEALFGGIYKPLSLQKLILSTFQVRGSLYPITKSFGFFVNLNMLVLGDLAIDDFELYTFLESLSVIPCLQYLRLKIQPLSNADYSRTEGSMVARFELNSLRALILNDVCISSLLARALGRSIPLISSLETLELTGIKGSILKVEDMKALFDGIHETMPLRKLTLSGFNMRGCLAPLTNKLSFLLNLEVLDLKMLNLDYGDVSGLLENLSLLRFLNKLILSNNPLGVAVKQITPYIIPLPALKVSLHQTASEEILNDLREVEAIIIEEITDIEA